MKVVVGRGSWHSSLPPAGASPVFGLLPRLSLPCAEVPGKRVCKCESHLFGPTIEGDHHRVLSTELMGIAPHTWTKRLLRFMRSYSRPLLWVGVGPLAPWQEPRRSSELVKFRWRFAFRSGRQYVANSSHKARIGHSAPHLPNCRGVKRAPAGRLGDY